MSAILLTPPLVEPISLAEIKTYLKLDLDTDDELLRAFVASARLHLEHLTGRHFIAQTWRVALEGPLQSNFTVPVAPISMIIDAAVLSSDGDWLPLEPEAFCIKRAENPSLIQSADGYALMPGQRLQLDLETGFGPTPDDVPQPLRQAIKMVVAEWYERRLIAGPDRLTGLSKSIEPLIAPYRSIRL